RWPCAFARPDGPRPVPSFPTRRSSDLNRDSLRKDRVGPEREVGVLPIGSTEQHAPVVALEVGLDLHPVPLVKLHCQGGGLCVQRSEEHTSELQSLTNLVCRLLLARKNQ